MKRRRSVRPKSHPKPRKKSRSVFLISAWIILTNVYWFWKSMDGRMDFNVSLLTMAAWVFYAFSILCALGLSSFKSWAWRTTIVLLSLHTLWNLYIVYFQIVPSFSQLVTWLSNEYLVSLNVMRCGLLTLLVSYLLWPAFAILSLMHPNVKSKFPLEDEKKLAFEEVPPG